jgi:hypothetical protein
MLIGILATFLAADGTFAKLGAGSTLIDVALILAAFLAADSTCSQPCTGGTGEVVVLILGIFDTARGAGSEFCASGADEAVVQLVQIFISSDCADTSGGTGADATAVGGPGFRCIAAIPGAFFCVAIPIADVFKCMAGGFAIFFATDLANSGE